MHSVSHAIDRGVVIIDAKRSELAANSIAHHKQRLRLQKLFRQLFEHRHVSLRREYLQAQSRAFVPA